MKELNAAQKIREFLGCYNHEAVFQEAPQVKRKKISYGSLLQKHFDKQRKPSNKGCF